MPDDDFEAQLFVAVAGSATSTDGSLFVINVVRPDGEQVNLAFPHEMLPKIVEHISVQSPNAKDGQGRKLHFAINTASFALGRNPAGDAVLGLQIGPVGTINFLLPGNMPEQLMDLLAQYVAKEKPKLTN